MAQNLTRRAKFLALSFEERCARREAFEELKAQFGAEHFRLPSSTPAAKRLRAKFKAYRQAREAVSL